MADGTQLYRVRHAQNDDASIFPRRKPKHIGKVEVGRHENASLGLADRNQLLFVRAVESLSGDGGCVVARFLEEFDGPVAEVLVGLYLQAGRSRRTSTNRSRLISAP